MRGTAALVAAILSIAIAVAPAGAQQGAGPPADNLPNPEAQTVARPGLSSSSAIGYSCPFCDLRGADLSGRDLTDANLHGANLEGVNLKGANLKGAVLSNANLTNADLSDAQLGNSGKGRADLSKANLSGANMSGASLDGTDLQFVDVDALERQGADVSRALVPKPPLAAAGSTITCGNADLSKLSARIYVDSAGTDGDSCGSTSDAPCGTITTAIRLCSARQGCGVLVMYGEYQPSDTIVLVDGVSVYGGCIAGTAGTPPQSLIRAPANGKPAISAANISKTLTLLQSFRLEGSAAVTPSSATSVTLLVSNSPKLSVIDSQILAGAGASGTAGAAGSDGAAGTAASGAQAGSVAACPASAGGNGSVTMNVSVTETMFTYTCSPSCSANGCYGYHGATGAAGGKWGSGNCAECPSARGDTGLAGASGSDALCGGKGTASANIAGNFSDGTWHPSVGGSGTAGGYGPGGGGGGAGGYRGGSCFWVKTADRGNQGGGAGAGGCGGAPGGGGQQGGASFAVALIGSPLVLTNSVVVGGAGGAGGKGGSAGRGGARGAGAAGLSNYDGGYGGPGGNGGAGGAGGGGAGGNGGPGVGIALVGNSSLSDSGTVYYTGASGATGASGSGGQPIVAGACTGPSGAAGNPGVAVDKRAY